MKLCLINNYYGAHARGGAESVVYQIAKAAKTAGHQVLIISGGMAEVRQRKPEGYWLTLETPWLFNRGRYQKLIAHLFGKTTARRLAEELKIYQPDLVISNNVYGLGLAVLSTPWRAGFKQYHILHDTQLLHPSGLVYAGHEALIDNVPAQVFRFLARRHTKGITRVISPSDWLLAWHRQRGLFTNINGAVLPNPKPLNDIKRPENKLPWKLLFVGQLEKHKGVEVLLKAWSILSADKNWDCRLVIVGSGTLEAEVQAAANKDKHLIYRGHLEASEVYMIMQDSHLLIMPSIVWENAPLVLSEAAAVGLPAIGSDLGGIAEIISNPSRLFVPNQAEDLVLAIFRILKNYDWSEPKAPRPFSNLDYLEALFK